MIVGDKLLGSDKQASIQRVRQKYPDAAVLIISESVTMSCLRTCIEGGAAGYIMRDALVKQLLTDGVAGVSIVELSPPLLTLPNLVRIHCGEACWTERITFSLSFSLFK